MEHLHADRRFPRRLAAVDHAYMLVYSRDMHRLAFQRIQMPMLGVDASLVTGFDLEELSSAHRTCVFGAAAAARPATKYSSQLVKLWSIFFDIVRRRRHWSLVFEDDAIAQPDRLWAVDSALRLLHGAGHNATVSPPPSVVHLSSYHPIGHDMVPCGLQPRHRANKQYMAGVANAVTLIGARELLRVPIEATGSDAAFSDSVLNSTSQLAAFYMKPYAFTAGSYADSSVFSCNLSIPCESAFYRRWGGLRVPHNISTWPAHHRAGLPEAELGNLPSAGCPELLDCQGQLRHGIKTSKYGTRCVQDDVKALRSAKPMAPAPRRPGHASDACTDDACVLASRLLYVR